MKSRISKLYAQLEKAIGGREIAPFFFDTNPVPASRPRVGRWGVFYSKTYKEYRNVLAEKIKAARRSFGESPVAVLMEFVVQPAKTTKRKWPRGDVDNFEKAVLDALTQHAKIWKDDDQVLISVTAKRYAEPGEKPGTHITVWRLP